MFFLLFKVNGKIWLDQKKVFIIFYTNKITIFELEGPQPVVLPLFDLIKKGKTKKDFDTNRKCRIDLNSGQVNNFLNFEGDYLEHHSGISYF